MRLSPRGVRARHTYRSRAGASIALVAVLALAGCANDPLAEQYTAGDNKGYIAGDFRVVEIAEEDRGEPVVFEGTLDTGENVSSSDYDGDVLVVNFWYAACGPCIVEAPRLEEAYQAFPDDDVAFLGVNTYDQAPTSLAFAADNGVTYPSIIAVNDGAVKLSFAEATPLNATPTTIVLDKEGRVSARIVGELPDASVLTALVRDALAEDS